ncbi:MAG: Cna protein B-type domain protein [Acidobacteria bacterium]|nr:Cna protein B-type domain protein [Acidobacteriota bacterium]
MAHFVKNCWLASTAALAVLVISGTATAQQQVGSPEPTAVAPALVSSQHTGTINGHVMIDSGRSLEGVKVLLSQAGASGPAHQATTDDNGEFRFDDLHDGIYTVVGAVAHGYFISRQPTNAIEPDLHYLGDSINIKLVKGGVITGKVLDARGDAVVGVSVRSVRTRDLEGLPPDGDLETAGQTDDRGIYRIYGLKAGIYVVEAGGSRRDLRVDSYKNDSPTYYPSETRATAREISVQAGGETSSIDIRYRGDAGHSVSGNIIGPAALSPALISVMLLYSGSDTVAAFPSPSSNNDNRAFSFSGVADGEYELLIRVNNPSLGQGFIATRAVTMKGADIVGLKISPAPLGSVTGQIQVDPSVTVAKDSKCKMRHVLTTETVMLIARKSEASQSKPDRMLPNKISGSPNEKGQFAFHNLGEGIYRLEARLPNDAWYVKSITLSAGPSKSQQSGSSKTIDVARLGFSLKPGENLGNLFITLAYGAAGIQGRTAVSRKADSPQRVSLHLVPAEREFEDDPLHYAEVPVSGDGSFSIGNLPPGRYWMISRPVFDSVTNSVIKPLAWDPNERAKLRDEAKPGSPQLELQPCQRVTEYVLP